MTKSIGAKRNKEDSEDEDRRDRKRVARGNSGTVELGQSDTEQNATDDLTTRMATLGPPISQNGSHFNGRYDLQTGTSLHQGNLVNNYQTADRCLADLRVTDPRLDKKRIQDTKGGLLTDAYVWVLENPDFCQWRHSHNQRLLWVKGNPGKGKTVLFCGVVDHLQTPPAEGRRLAYFFCQATDERINTATALLRGLIYMLLDQDPSLVSHMKKKYDAAGKALFEDTNAWQALLEVFTNMLQDPKLQGVCLVVDALDECVTGLEQLLDLIAHTSQSTSAKWLVSSRNWPQIEEQLRNVARRLSLELNAESVSAAVDSYITFKVSRLMQRKGYGKNTADEVRRYLSLNADGTFLWVALVCQELEKAQRWNVLQKVNSFPAGLDAFYDRIMWRISGLDTAESWDADTAELCKQVLALVATTYRPPSLAEFTTFIEEFYEIEDVRSLQEIISL